MKTKITKLQNGLYTYELKIIVDGNIYLRKEDAVKEITKIKEMLDKLNVQWEIK